MSTDRSPAQYCPYCGETNLFPHEEGHGSWECRDCRRVFAVRFIGIAGAPEAPVTDPDAAAAAAIPVTDPGGDPDRETFPPVVAVEPSISGGTS